MSFRRKVIATIERVKQKCGYDSDTYCQTPWYEKPVDIERIHRTAQTWRIEWKRKLPAARFLV